MGGHLATIPGAPGARVAAADTTLPQGLTSGDWLRAGITLAVAVLVAGFLSRLVGHLLDRGDTPRLAAQLVVRLVSYAIVASGFLYALIAVHIDVGPLVGALGIGGLALALATQDLLSNALGSVLLEIGRAVHRGDFVSIGEHQGIVEDVDLRTVVLRTMDGDRVFLPNSSVLRGPIANHTALGHRRTTLRLGVAYASDLEEASALACRAAVSVHGVARAPAPQALVREFGDSAITIALWFWHAPLDRWVVRDSVAVAVKKAFDAAGIEMAFPQRTVWIAGDARATGASEDGASALDDPEDGTAHVLGRATSVAVHRAGGRGDPAGPARRGRA